MNQFVGPPKRRGRPPGPSGKPPVKLGPRVGSRPWSLSRMKVGDRLYLETTSPTVTQFMQQVAADISRLGLNGHFKQTLLLGVNPHTRQVTDLVVIERINKE